VKHVVTVENEVAHGVHVLTVVQVAQSRCRMLAKHSIQLIYKASGRSEFIFWLIAKSVGMPVMYYKLHFDFKYALVNAMLCRPIYYFYTDNNNPNELISTLLILTPAALC